MAITLLALPRAQANGSLRAPLSEPPPCMRGPTVWRIVRGLSEELRSYARPVTPEGQPLPSFLKSVPRRVLRVGASALIASARYRPGFYPGELTLFTAVEREARSKFKNCRDSWLSLHDAVRGKRSGRCINIVAASSSDETCVVAFTYQHGLDVRLASQR